jgi:hypothetical protein
MGRQRWGGKLRTPVIGVLIAGALAAATVVPATAEPPPVPPPADPMLPPTGPVVPGLGAPLGPQGFSVLQQTGLPPVDALGTPALPDLDPRYALGQNPVPSAPGAPPAPGPNPNAFNNGYWLQQNMEPSAPGDGTVVGVAPGEENADIGRIEWLRQLHELRQNGSFANSFLGGRPLDALGQPLPGTAPLPGTNLPPGVPAPPG